MAERIRNSTFYIRDVARFARHIMNTHSVWYDVDSMLDVGECATHRIHNETCKYRPI
jgi:hypothetical protein